MLSFIIFTFVVAYGVLYQIYASLYFEFRSA